MAYNHPSTQLTTVNRLSQSHSSPHSVFTPINRPSQGPIFSPLPFTQPARHEQTQRQHNPIIAQYLGLGVESSASSPHATTSTSNTKVVSGGERQNLRKRRTKQGPSDGVAEPKVRHTRKKRPKHTPCLEPIPEHPVPGQLLTPYESQPTISRSNQALNLSSDELSFQPPSTFIGLPRSSLTDDDKLSSSSNVNNVSHLQPPNEPPNALFQVHGERQFWTSSSPLQAVPDPEVSDASGELIADSNTNSSLHVDHLQKSTARRTENNRDDHVIFHNRIYLGSDEIIDNIELSSGRFEKHAKGVCPHDTNHATNHTDDFYDDGIDDDDLLDIMDSTPAAIDDMKEENHHRLDSRSGSSGHPVTSTPKSTAKKFISPATQLTQIRSSTSASTENKTPIVRVPFPSQVRDRSPVIGLSSAKVLRTCFRIGEAINAGRDAVKNNKDVLLEVYARVVESSRVEGIQTFVFCDLFHTKPPYIKAEYPSTIWKGSALHDIDSGRLLAGNRMCRCMGTMRREEKEWTLQVLNIWECTWEDIEWVKAIVNA